MMLDILRVVAGKDKIILPVSYDTVLSRAQRYGQLLERQISPEGTFPPTGRSLAYRFGAFQLLAQLALQKNLPASLTPAQVRCALGAVIQKNINMPGTFDSQGFLNIGFAGHQPSIGENYISTGSLYLCAAIFLPLGLPANDQFWTAKEEQWTAKKIYQGIDLSADKAIG